MNYGKVAPLSLFLIFILLVSLIPGGPIENRDFSHLNPLAVWLYNGLLTVLGFGTLVLAFFMILGKRYAFRMGVFVGLAWLILTLFDLLQIFPTSPTPMSFLLFSIELSIIILSIIATLCSYKAMKTMDHNSHPAPVLRRRIWLIAGPIILILGAIAIIYASLSIIYSGSG